MTNAFAFAPASLVTDGKTGCTRASAERNSCCAMTRVTTEPTLSIDLDKYVEVNTVRILLPDVYRVDLYSKF